MYSMKETCKKTNLTYETLKYYCNEGLVPNVKRDKNNYRIFDDIDIAWINSIKCLKNCEMSIVEIKEYLRLCLVGKESIPTRKKFLDIKKKALLDKLRLIEESIDYIDMKQEFYDDILNGKIEYVSNLIKSTKK